MYITYIQILTSPTVWSLQLQTTIAMTDGGLRIDMIQKLQTSDSGEL